MQAFRFSAWIVASVYATIPAFWLIAHGFIARWRRRGVVAYRSLLLYWMAFILIGLSLTSNGKFVTAFFHPALAIALAIPCWTAAFLLYFRIPEFGVAHFAGMSEMRAQRDDLVISGMHAYVRHPIYLGHWIMLTGWALAADTQATLRLWLWATVTGAIMLHVEERELLARFGSAYEQYRRRVPMILPRSAKLFRLSS